MSLPPGDPAVLGAQVENLHGKVGSLEKSFETLGIAVRAENVQLRQEMTAANATLRQEVGQALTGMKQDNQHGNQQLMTAIANVAKDVSDRSRPNYTVTISFASLLLAFIVAIGSLSMRSYDVSIAKIEKRLDGHDDSIVPRSEFTRFVATFDRIVDRFNLRMDRQAERTAAVETQAAKTAAVQEYRIKREASGR